MAQRAPEARCVVGNTEPIQRRRELPNRPALELAVVASGPSLGDLEAGAVASFTSIGFAVVSGGVPLLRGVGSKL